MTASLDTPLARLLHARGLVSLAALQEALRDARAERPDGATLATRLVARGLLPPGAAQALVGELDGALAETPVGRPAGPFEPGAVVAEHRIVRLLGAGGMGIVYEAEHLSTGARRALKTLPLSAAPELLVRFGREAELLARVDRHEHVVRVHGVTQAHGRQVLIMDLLPGGDLAARLAAGPLPVDEVLDLGVALARGLTHLHAHGVLHRDLKPHNVLFDERGVPRLADFGLALGAGVGALTATGEVLGTPAYMAPEQARGDRAALGPWTDVYGLGAVLFHALAGEPPFVGGSFFDVLARACEQAPPSPRRRRPEVPPALDRVVLRALAKRAEDRYPTARALEEALLAARAPAPPARRARWLRPGVAIAALAAAAFAGARVGQDERRRSEAAQALERAAAYDATVLRPWALDLGPGARPSAGDLARTLGEARAAAATLGSGVALVERLDACARRLGGERDPGRDGPTALLVAALGEPRDLARAVAHLRAADQAPPLERALVRAELERLALEGGPRACTQLLTGLASVSSAAALDPATAALAAGRKAQALDAPGVVGRWAPGLADWVERGDARALDAGRDLARLLAAPPRAAPAVEAAFLDRLGQGLAPAARRSDEALARALALDRWLRARVGVAATEWPLAAEATKRIARRDRALPPEPALAYLALALGDLEAGLLVLQLADPRALEPLLPDPAGSRAARVVPLLRGGPLTTPERISLAIACLDAGVDDLSPVQLDRAHEAFLTGMLDRDRPPGLLARAEQVIAARRALVRAGGVDRNWLGDVLRLELLLRCELEGWGEAPAVVRALEAFLDDVPPGRDGWARDAAHARTRLIVGLDHGLTTSPAALAPLVAGEGLRLAERLVTDEHLHDVERWDMRAHALSFLRATGRTAQARERVGELDPDAWGHPSYAVEVARTLRAVGELDRARDVVRRGLRRTDWQTGGGFKDLQDLAQELQVPSER